jgi:integrase
MRGHIIKRGKNSYSVAISLGKDPTTGKYKQQWISVRGNKKDAERRLSELLHQIDNGTFIIPSKTTLAEYLERWLRDYVWPNLSPETAEGYEHIIHRYIIRYLGSVVLTQLKPEHLQKYYSERIAGGLSAQTIRHHHSVIHKALKDAMEWGLLNRNIADAVSPPRVQRPDLQTWNENYITRFLEEAKGGPYYALFYTALFTGMRRSELLALCWKDVDFMLAQISVNRSLHVLKGGNVIFRSTKTAMGRRTIALPPSAIITLKEHKEMQELERTMLGIPVKEDDLVFAHFDGSPLLPNSVSHAWIKLVRRSGLKSIRLHDARHSHASLMLKQGIHPKIVQERLGHASIQVTLDTYSHVAPGLQAAAAKRFDEAFYNVYNKPENETVEKNY